MREQAELERECAVFSRYLCGELPGEYVLAKYCAAHAVGAIEPPGGATRFDRALVSLARRGTWSARALDSHARVFANGGLLRRKLVALLAILETRAPTDSAVDTPSSASVAAFVLGMVWCAVVFALTVLVTAVALLPLRIVCALGAQRTS